MKEQTLKLSKLRRVEIKSLSKLKKRTDELTEHLEDGTGKPERLKGNLTGY